LEGAIAMMAALAVTWMPFGIDIIDGVIAWMLIRQCMHTIDVLQCTVLRATQLNATQRNTTQLNATQNNSNLT
jgi:hypothetical protein